MAAAVVGGAGAIVTDNLKHFPADPVPTRIHAHVTSEGFADVEIACDTGIR